MVEVQSIPAFRDNYIWLVVGEGASPAVAIVDPGDAGPVLQVLARRGLVPTTLLITHHHSDHVGGVDELCARYPLTVYGPAGERIPRLTHALREGDTVSLPGLPVFGVSDVPGHTAGHIAYHGGGLLFCGDTLFAGGCGRLFEGTAAQMHASLQKLAALPADTLVYCAHEYTLGNLRFALAVEPDNRALQARYETTEDLRRRGLPTVPATLELEKDTNPFLRCDMPTVTAAASRHAGRPRRPGVETFATVRDWKDHWNG